MGKPQKHQDNWTLDRVALSRPNILTRVDGTMYMGLVESADSANAVILANGQRWNISLKTVCGALNSGNPLYVSTGAALPIGVEAVNIDPVDNCADLTRECQELVADNDFKARSSGAPKP